MSNYNSDFHIAEYNTIKAEISANTDKVYTILFYLIAANAFILTWSMQQSTLNQVGNTVVNVASWMPLILTGSAYLLCLSLRNRNNMLFGYCGKLEEVLAASELGWEKLYRTQGRKKLFLNSYTTFNIIFLVQLGLGIYYIYLMNFAN